MLQLPEVLPTTPYEAALRRAETAERLLGDALMQIQDEKLRAETVSENLYGVIAMRRKAAIMMAESTSSSAWILLRDEYEEIMYLLGLDDRWEKEQK